MLPGGAGEVGMVGCWLVLWCLYGGVNFSLPSKECTSKPGRIGNLDKCCSGLEKSSHDMEKSG